MHPHLLRRQNGEKGKDGQSPETGPYGQASKPGQAASTLPGNRHNPQGVEKDQPPGCGGASQSNPFSGCTRPVWSINDPMYRDYGSNIQLDCPNEIPPRRATREWPEGRSYMPRSYLYAIVLSETSNSCPWVHNTRASVISLHTCTR
jgi:hypothetical protein